MLPLIARATQEVLLLVPQPAARRRRRARRQPLAHDRSASSCPARSAASSPARCSPSRAPPARPRRCCFTSLDLQPTSSDRSNVFGQALPNIPVHDLHALRAGRPGRLRARLGRGVRAAGVHPDREPRRARRCSRAAAGSCADERWPDDEDARRRWTPARPRCGRADDAARRARAGARASAPTAREVVFDVARPRRLLRRHARARAASRMQI